MATVESIIYGALGSLASGNVYPDLAPSHTPAPWITYQAVGGNDYTGLDGVSQTRNSRVQVNVWAHTRAEASELMEQVRTLLVAPPVRAVPIGSPFSIYEPDTQLYGSRLDLSVTYS